jgi:hypothetical protein
MKKIVILLVMLVAVSQAFSQKKGKVDPEKVAIDSLTKVNSALAAQLDSVSKDRELYYGLYTVIKEKVIKYNFDPSKASFLIDSLKQGRESVLYDLNLKMHDTLAELNFENKKLMAELYRGESDRCMLTEELKMLKELLDAKIITQQEFDAKKAIVMEKWK